MKLVTVPARPSALIGTDPVRVSVGLMALAVWDRGPCMESIH